VLILERGVNAASTSASADSPELSKSPSIDGSRSDLKVALRVEMRIAGGGRGPRAVADRAQAQSGVVAEGGRSEEG